MASTIELQTTANYASIFVRMMPLVSVGGFANEPAVSIANQVLEYLLAPPLAWSWNRSTNDATLTVAGTQDYPIVLATFGWLEKATLTDAAERHYELEVSLVLPEDSTQARPVRIAAQLDPGTGTITFRLHPVPDAAYTLNLTFQNAPALFTSLAQTWAPVPDRLSYVYTTGFLAKVYEMADDGRFSAAMGLFLNQIVGAANGLSETQKNLFLWNRLRDLREMTEVPGGGVPRETRNLERG